MRMKAVSFIALAVLLLGAFSLRSVAETNVYRKKDSVGKKIALTFDDGPHPRLTPKILGILEKYGVRATFFVIGQNAQNYPDAMRLLVSSGCEVGYHTFTHKNMRLMSEEDITLELERSRTLLEHDFGTRAEVLRPPQGQYSESLSQVASRYGYDIILWSIDTRDWAHTPAEQIAHNIISCASEGDIILMHDYVSGYSPTCDALEIFIPEMQRRGYEFVTVSELIKE